jgi:hypothetical protein
VENALDQLTADHEGQHVTIELLDPSVGYQHEAERLPFAYINFDPKDDVIVIAVGGKSRCLSLLSGSGTAVPELLLLLPAQRDPARFARLGDRDRQHEQAAVVIRGQLVRIEVVAEEQLPGEGA